MAENRSAKAREAAQQAATLSAHGERLDDAETQLADHEQRLEAVEAP